MFLSVAVLTTAKKNYLWSSLLMVMPHFPMIFGRKLSMPCSPQVMLHLRLSESPVDRKHRQKRRSCIEWKARDQVGEYLKRKWVWRKGWEEWERSMFGRIKCPVMSPWYQDGLATKWLQITNQMLKRETTILHLHCYIKELGRLCYFTEWYHYKIIRFFKLKKNRLQQPWGYHYIYPEVID